MDDQLNPNDISGLNASGSSTSPVTTPVAATPSSFSPQNSAPNATQEETNSALATALQPLNNQVAATTQAPQPIPTTTRTAPQMPANSQPANAVVSDPLLTDKTFSEDLDARWNSWKCLNCGYIYEGIEPKNVCPRCGNSDPDKFGDRD